MKPHAECCFSSTFLPSLRIQLQLRQPTRRRPRAAALTNRRRVAACAEPHATLPDTLIDLTRTLKAEESAVNRYASLIQLGNQYQAQFAPDGFLAAGNDNRVAGCISIVYISTKISPNDEVQLSGTSDSAVTRGILALLIMGTRSLPTEPFLALNPQAIAAAAGLASSSGGASRSASLTRILTHAQNQVRGILTGNSNSNTKYIDNTRSSRRGKEDTAVLLSGGVDSAVALRLAQESGKRVRAFYLRIWLAEDEAYLGSCPWEDDIASARAVCEQAGVELETVSLQKEYRERVIEYVVREARNGRTPNPDVMCNSRVKFGAFYEFLNNTYDSVVSGHYAVVDRNTNVRGEMKLRTSPDRVKDQTYFLAGLTQEQLRKAHFPLGEFDKSHVRYLANEIYKLPNAQRPDSQGVCFLGKLKWRDFLKIHLGVNKGDFIEWETGKTVGVHDGFWFYTLGQRKGMGLCDGPWYVVSKDIESNSVFVSKQYWEEHMERSDFAAEQLHWIGGRWPGGSEKNANIGVEIQVQVKVRHGPNVHQALMRRTDENTAHVTLETRDKALAPGQFAVFYDGDVCLGCGIIASRFLQRETQLITGNNNVDKEMANEWRSILMA